MRFLQVVLICCESVLLVACGASLNPFVSRNGFLSLRPSTKCIMDSVAGLGGGVSIWLSLGVAAEGLCSLSWLLRLGDVAGGERLELDTGERLKGKPLFSGCNTLHLSRMCCALLRVAWYSWSSVS